MYFRKNIVKFYCITFYTFHRIPLLFELNIRKKQHKIYQWHECYNIKTYLKKFHIQKAQPVVIPQALTDNINALQNKLDISETNAKNSAAAIAKIQTGQVTPVANYYVTAPTVEKAADVVHYHRQRKKYYQFK